MDAKDKEQMRHHIIKELGGLCSYAMVLYGQCEDQENRIKILDSWRYMVNAQESLEGIK